MNIHFRMWEYYRFSHNLKKDFDEVLATILEKYGVEK